MSLTHLYTIYPFNLLKELYEDTAHTIDFELFDLEIDKSLSPKERMLIKCLFEDNLSRDDIASRFSVTRERVRQLHQKAINKLTHPQFVKRVKKISYADYIHLKFERDTKNKILNDLLTVVKDKFQLTNTSNSNSNTDVKEERIVEALDLSTRSYNALTRAGIYTVKELQNLGLKRLKKVRNLGIVLQTEILNELNAKGYEFKVK